MGATRIDSESRIDQVECTEIPNDLARARRYNTRGDNDGERVFQASGDSGGNVVHVDRRAQR
jgi:hypothetical protein